MKPVDRKAIGVMLAWLIVVAFLSEHGTDHYMRLQMLKKLAAGAVEPLEEIDPPPNAGPAERPNTSETATADEFTAYDDRSTERPNTLPPMAPTPLEIRISGPVDSLVGDLVELHAETTQDATQYAWSIAPPVRGLMILDDGEKAVFANREAGDYLVIVSCANAQGQSAHATMPFTIRPAPPENPLTVESLAEANPPPDVRDLIRRWVAEVVTDNRAGETAAVAASLRQVSNLLSTNQLAATPGADALFEVERVAETTMGPTNFPKWASFFGRVRDFIYPLNQRGYVQTPQQYANVFNNLAGELEAIAAGR